MEPGSRYGNQRASYKRPFQDQSRSMSNTRKRYRSSESTPELGSCSGLSHLLEIYQHDWESPSPGSRPGNPFLVEKIHAFVAANLLNHVEVYQLLEDANYTKRVLWPTLLTICRQYTSEQNDRNMNVVAFSFLQMFNYHHRANRQHAAVYKQLLETEPSIFPTLITFLFRSDEPWQEDVCADVLQFLSHAFNSLDVSSIRTTLLPLISLPAWVNLSPSVRASKLETNPLFQSLFSKILRKVRRRKSDDTPPLAERFVKILLRNYESAIASFAKKKNSRTLNIINTYTNLLSTILSNPSLHQIMQPLLVDRATLPLLIAALAKFDDDDSFDGASSTDLSQTFHVVKRFRQQMDPLIETRKISSSTSPSFLDVQIAAYALSEDPKRPDNSALRSLSLKTHDSITIETLSTSLKFCTDDSLDVLFKAVKLHGTYKVLFPEEKDAETDTLPKPLLRELKIRALAFICQPFDNSIYGLQNMEWTVTDEEVKNDVGLNLYPPIFPDINQRFHSLAQCLLSNFSLCKCEAIHRVCHMIEGAMELNFQGGPTAPLHRVHVVQVTPPLPGCSYPQSVSVSLELAKKIGHRDMQEALKYGDAVYIVNKRTKMSASNMSWDSCSVRGMIIGNEEGSVQPVLKQGLVCELDPIQYYRDTNVAHVEENAYVDFDVLVRAPRGVSELHGILKALKTMASNPEKIVANWVSKILVGVTPKAASDDDGGVDDGARDPANIDLRDTFISKEHLSKSFPSKLVSFVEPDAPKKTLRVHYKVTESGGSSEGGVEAFSYYPSDARVWPSNQNNESVNYCNENEYNSNQVSAICHGMKKGLTLVDWQSTQNHQSDNMECISQLVRNLYHTDGTERVLVVCRAEQTLFNFLSKLRTKGLDATHVLHFGDLEQKSKHTEDITPKGVIQKLEQRRQSLLSVVNKLAMILKVSRIGEVWTCATAEIFWENNIMPFWERFRRTGNPTWDQFPFGQLFEELFKDALKRDSHVAFDYLRDLFQQLKHLQFLEVLSTERLRLSYLVSTYARVIGMTTVTAALQRECLLSQGFSYTTIIVLEAGAMLEAETLIALALQGGSYVNHLRRAVLVSDQKRESPSVLNGSVRNVGNLQQSLFTRLARNGATVLSLT